MGLKTKYEVTLHDRTHDVGMTRDMTHDRHDRPMI